MKRILTLIRHWREAKTAFSTLAALYGDKIGSMDALGGLTEEEMRAVVGWATEDIGMTVVEVGTLLLFHRMGRSLRRQRPGPFFRKSDPILFAYISPPVFSSIPNLVSLKLRYFLFVFFGFCVIYAKSKAINVHIRLFLCFHCFKLFINITDEW